MQHIGKIAWLLVVIGAINWGLVGALQIDLVAMIFGSMPMIAKVVYILIGLAGVYKLTMIKACMASCDK